MALRVRATDGNFRKGHPAPAENDAHPCASPLRGLTHRRRRCGWGPGEEQSNNCSNNSNSNNDSRGNLKSRINRNNNERSLACGRHP
jgi:hypothetical protein